MSRGYFPVAALAMAGVAMTGCGGAPFDDAMRLPGASPTDSQPSSQASLNVTASTPNLYFGVTNHVHIGGDVVAAMSLNAGAVVEMEVATTDSSPLRFELWEIHDGGWNELINAFDVASGFALTSFTAPSDNVFVVHFPAPAAEQDVNIHLDCDRTSGRCTAALQPGERCFEQTACSSGLSCAPTDGTCSSIWWGGACVVPNDDTACEGIAMAPVCGCDGVTYANECLAVASGSGMRTTSACPAPLPPG